MSREERLKTATRLRDGGLTVDAVAQEMGVSRSVVVRLLYPTAEATYRRHDATPERNAQKRAWENEHDRGLCACGSPTGVGATRKGTTHCRECADEIVAVGRAMRDERIFTEYERGLTVREIGEVVGRPATSVNVAIVRMRKGGWDLPYRRAGWKPGTNTGPRSC